MHPLERVRLRLLDLHRVLLDLEREEYERRHGPVTPTGYLTALTTDPMLAWLKPLTTAIVSLDEILDARGGVKEEDCRESLRYVRDLLTPAEDGTEFQRRYADALQQWPAAVLSHAAVLQAL